MPDACCLHAPGLVARHQAMLDERFVFHEEITASS
jgi:hypothetical protein